MSTPLLGLARDIVRANFGACELPYNVTLVATYHCNFRCGMCHIWQKKSVDEVTPAAVAAFFDRWAHFRGVRRRDDRGDSRRRSWFRADRSPLEHRPRVAALFWKRRVAGRRGHAADRRSH